MISFAEARRTMSGALGPGTPMDVIDPTQHAQQAGPMGRTVSAAELRSLAAGGAVRMATAAHVRVFPVLPVQPDANPGVATLHCAATRWRPTRCFIALSCCQPWCAQCCSLGWVSKRALLRVAAQMRSLSMGEPMPAIAERGPASATEHAMPGAQVGSAVISSPD